MESISHTHVAYGDESFYNRGRYRSIAILTLEARAAAGCNRAVRELLEESGLREFKWQKLRQARERFAALKLVDFVIARALDGALRVDVLIWDTHDSRHQVRGRDDVANLQRMYYHLFKHALRRWPGDNVWALYPDQHSALDWETVQDYLVLAGLAPQPHAPASDLFRTRLRHEFRIDKVQEVDSKRVPLCQVADLFAGLSAFSWQKFDTFCLWEEQQRGQLGLFPVGHPLRLSNSDRERCTVLAYLDWRCKAHKLGVSLRTRGGLWTPQPANPINFWFYEPQHPADKAPTKG